MSAPLDRDALLAFLRERAAAARVDHTPGLLVTAVLGGLVSRIESGQFDVAQPESDDVLIGLKPGTTYYIKAAGHHDRTPIVTDSIVEAFALVPQCSCQSSFDGEGDGSCAVHRDDGTCEWDIDDGDGGHTESLPHEFSGGDDDCCVNCGTPNPEGGDHG